MKYGPATFAMHYKGQTAETSGDRTTIVTTLEDDNRCQIYHTVVYETGDRGITVQTIYANHSDETVCLDFLTSVSLDNLSPFAAADPERQIVLHRFYGGWSLEGKHREDFLEDLNLERSWMCAFPESEKFGSIGSYPVHRYIPMACVEDRKEQVFWGIQLEAASSWQMELSRDGDCCSFSAGIADIEFGSWSKNIKPGDTFVSTKAYVSAGDSLDHVCHQILNMHHKAADQQPQVEQQLPIVFNDWCATYGEPSHQKTLEYAEMLQGTPVKYIVIDAGWTESLEKSFGQGRNGDWNYSVKKFPHGMKKVAEDLREKGFLLGIWFELEVTTVGAVVYGKDYDAMHLKRNGQVINTGGDRTFWDFRNPDTRKYLHHKVIDFLKENQISYLKIDYNSSIGIGCDGAESLGEGLRLQMNAVQNFLRTIREEIPDIVIENCAAGGHRLEASFIDLTAMSCFSDAHECKDSPYTAANLQRLVPARKNQVWVVLNECLTEKEIYYRLAVGFLGRFCLSGNIEQLSDSKWGILKHALNFYGKITDIIKYGEVVVHRVPENTNMYHLQGIQIVERKYQNQYLLVIHSFTQTTGYTYCLETSGLSVRLYLGSPKNQPEVDGNLLKLNHIGPEEGLVVLLSM